MNEKRSAEMVLRRLTEPLTQAMPGALRTATLFVVGVLLAQTPVLGQYRPFAAAWAAAVPLNGLAAGAAGALLGALLQGFGGAPAACAVLLVGSVRWMLSEWKSLTAHPLFAPGCAAGAVLLTELLIRSVLTEDGVLWAGICQSMLAGGGTWFFARTAEVTGPEDWHRSAVVRRCTVLLAGCGLAALTGLRWHGLSPGGTAAMLIVLACAQKKQFTGGCVAGTILGGIFALSAGAEGLSFIGMSAIGLVAGCFAPTGRLLTAMTMPLTAGILVLMVPAVPDGLFYEAVAAAVLFVLIPARYTERAAQFLFYERVEASPQYMRRSVVMRLDFAARSIAHVSQSVEEVSQTLLRKCAPTMGGVYERAIEDTCAGCALRLLCWQSNYEANCDAMHRMTPILQEQGRIGRGDLPQELQGVCRRPD
ncbi:MAG: hypothetical protein IJY28_09985, partial [Clostridia bacterium]|nr:hypothetical protein [Clostridia bacterium]